MNNSYSTSNKTSYSQLLQRPEWQKKRLLILKRDKWACKLCKDEKSTLHVHHLSYTKGNLPWEYENSNFVTLCSCCHKEVEILKESHDEVDFKLIKVYKSGGWEDGCMLYFISYKGKLTFSSYDKNMEFIDGYVLSAQHLKNILPLIKSVLKNG